MQPQYPARRVRTALLALLAALLAVHAAPALAQQTSPSSAVVVSTRILVPAAANGFGVASPYPLAIPVSGIVGTVDLKVRLRGFSHTRPGDVSVVLVSPTGVATFLISDPVSGPVSAVDLEIQNGAPPLPSPIVSGTYSPSATFPNDLLPAPAPLQPYGLTLPTLAAAEANGTWQLFAADDFGGESGSIEGVDLIFTVANTVDGSAIPDGGVADFPVEIGGVSGAIAHVSARVFIFHPLTSQLDVSLVGPDGTEVGLTSGNGTGANYGLLVCTIQTNICAPSYTTFDDAAPTPVTAGTNPFTAAYQPEEPLAAFEGKSGAAANGTWRLRIRDRVPGGTGGLYRFELRVSDGGPLAADDTYVTPFETPLSVPAPGVLSNDDAQGAATLRATLTTDPAHGAVSFAKDGGFTYSPAAGFVGVDTFTYRPLSDEGLGVLTRVSITVLNTPVPQSPTALRVTSVDGNVVTFRWTPPTLGPVPTGYLLEGGATPGEVAAAIGAGPAPRLALSVPSGSFLVRVRTVTGLGISGPSNELPIHVNVPVPPSAPAGLLGLVSGSTVALSWRNTFDGGVPANLELHATGALTGVVPLPLAETVTFAGVPPGTYDLTLRAVNAAGGSGPSAAVQVVVPGPCSGPPGTPTNFLVYRDGTTVHTVWDPPSGGSAVTGYVLMVSGSYVGSVPTAARTFSAPAPAGTYSVSVAAVNSCGASVATPAQLVVVP